MTNFDWYLRNELKPALDWINTYDGRDFIMKTFDRTLFNHLFFHSDMIINSCYLITFKGVPLYIGEAVKVWQRCIVHAFHMATEPERYFGITADEVKEINITLLGSSIPNMKERKEKELEYRLKLEPILNPAELRDRCIPKNDRYEAVHRFYNDPDTLKEAIDLIVNKSPWAWGWQEVLHKTNCCDPDTIDVAYGLRSRIKQVINMLSKEERQAIYRNIAYSLGGCRVTTKTVLTCLERLLSGFDSIDDIKQMTISAAKMQCDIRMEFIKSMK